MNLKILFRQTEASIFTKLIHIFFLFLITKFFAGMIEIKDLHKSFGGKKVLDGVNLKIDTGETIVIIGKSGEGKSVLLKRIVRLLAPDKGEVLIE